MRRDVTRWACVGRTITFESRSAEGRADRLPALAAELVQRKVDVIVTGGGNVSTLAAQKATTTIPIVMVGSVGAVESGLVKSLARPGGNVTGVTVPRELGLKQLELLRAIIPSLSRVVVFSRSNFDTASQRAEAKAMALQFFCSAPDCGSRCSPRPVTAALADKDCVKVLGRNR